MKKYYSLENGNGILVTSLDFNERNLKINDVILSINGKNIANNGIIETTFGKSKFGVLNSLINSAHNCCPKGKPLPSKLNASTENPAPKKILIFLLILSIKLS